MRISDWSSDVCSSDLYAPGVVSFGDVDSYRDLGAVLSYQINRSASVFGGYRNVKVTNDGPDSTIDNGLYGGISLTFKAQHKGILWAAVQVSTAARATNTQSAARRSTNSLGNSQSPRVPAEANRKQ